MFVGLELQRHTMTFQDLDLIDPIFKAISQKGYKVPTEIQQKAIPEILQRKDILGIAQTGTGKTAAFAIPIIQLIYKIDKQRQAPITLRALILTPTRELAIQIDENIRTYNKHTHLKHTVIFGGVKAHKQIQEIKKGVQILVATPGRLLDLIGQGYITLEHLKMFVLDEADRMLDMGFIHDIKRVIKLLPEQRQTLFFSATMPDNIIGLSSNILNNPRRIEVARKSSPAETIDQYVYYTDRENKVALLSHILRNEVDDQVIVFVRTKHGADRLMKKLTRSNFKAKAIHGNKSQVQRQKALKQFKEGAIRILVATDIAARGIDVQQLGYVINYDIPNEPETYVHRIGRSGRAGLKGIAFSISEPEENVFIRGIEKLIQDKLSVISDHPFPQLVAPMTAAEKKAWNKEKQLRKAKFIQAKKLKRQSKQRGR